MGFLRYILLGCAACLAIAAQARLESADSIISRMHRAAASYVDYVHEYHAELYVKAQLDIIRKNRGFRFIPGLFRTPKNANRFIVETHSDLHYTSPNIYDQKITAYTSTLGQAREIPGITDYFNASVYAPYIVDDKILSPMAPNSHKYYRYAIDSVSQDAGHRIEYHIRFIPRNKSFKLVDGRMVVTEGAWSVREISFKGRSELLRFDCHVTMGAIGTDEEYLAKEIDINAAFSFAFNTLEGYYEAKLDYHDICHRGNTPEQEERDRKDYNLTASFSLQCDKKAYTSDYTRFDSLRPHPLDSAEISIYRKYHERLDREKAAEADSTRPPKKKDRWANVGDFFLTDSKWNLNPNATLRNSPFFNPLMFSYSRTIGLAYRQDLRLATSFRNGHSLQLRTRLGYNFTHNEFYWNVNGDYRYWPEHMGVLSVNVGNGNRIGNSSIIDQLKEIPSDSIVNFDLLNLDLFKDLHVELINRFEIVNGLSLGVGLTFHRRTPAERPDDAFRQVDLPPDVAEGLQSNIRPEYNSFAPRVRIEWTPGLYYYMNGNQKVNLHSRFPTMILDYERGLRNVVRSTGVYERIEFDLQHRLRTGLLSNLYYRFGVGFFTNQEETYFVDFVNFRRSNLPEGWNDEIGGVFQALDGQWYNASPYYVRGHITYEAPFLIMRHLMKYTSHVQNERLYLNMLTMDHLGPYFEVGYGIGTFVFDMGLFVSLEKFKQIGFGYKFTFELFSK